MQSSISKPHGAGLESALCKKPEMTMHRRDCHNEDSPVSHKSVKCRSPTLHAAGDDAAAVQNTHDHNQLEASLRNRLPRNHAHIYHDPCGPLQDTTNGMCPHLRFMLILADAKMHAGGKSLMAVWSQHTCIVSKDTSGLYPVRQQRCPELPCFCSCSSSCRMPLPNCRTTCSYTKNYRT